MGLKIHWGRPADPAPPPGARPDADATTYVVIKEADLDGLRAEVARLTACHRAVLLLVDDAARRHRGDRAAADLALDVRLALTTARH